MKTIKIFLASSDELREERTELADLVCHLNHILHKQNIDIELVKWEYLNQSMESIHKQEEYNLHLKQCDLCIVLYWTKFGIYTKAELDTAFSEHKLGHNPKKLYVYFKKVDVNHITTELKTFRDSFPVYYGHFSSEFNTSDSLKASFLLLLMDYQNAKLNETQMIEIYNSQVYVSKTPVVDLKNVSFMGNNEEYNRLLKDIKKTRKLLSITDVTDQEYSIYAQDLMDLEKKQQEIEESLWNTALSITHLSNKSMSERLQRAINLFNNGDNKGADAILNEEAINKDVDYNIRLIELGEAGKIGLKINIEELKLKINTLRNERAEGWIDKICNLHKKIAKLIERLYGEVSEELADYLAVAAYDFDFHAKYVEALDFYQRVLELRLKISEDNYNVTATCYNNIGLVYHHLGNYDRAMENYDQALKIWLNIFGEMYYSVAAIYTNIGNIYSIQGNFGKAMENFQEALKIRLVIFGANHHEVAACYNSIGTIYDNLGDYTSALENFKKALEIRIKIFGENNLEIANSINNIGTVYYRQGNYTKALEYHKKALKTKLNIFGEKHPAVATSYNNIGFVFDKQGICDLALENYEKALKIQLGIFDKNHSDVARSYNNIGGVYYTLRNYEKALECYDKALKILLNIFGEDNPYVATIYNNLGFINQIQGNYVSALENFEKAQKIQIPIFGDSHPRVEDLKGVISDLKQMVYQ